MIVTAEQVQERTRRAVGGRWDGIAMGMVRPGNASRGTRRAPRARFRQLPQDGTTITASQLSGPYYATDGLGSIFSKIGKAIGKAAKAVVHVGGKLLPIALPVAGGVVAGKLLAPIVGKGFASIIGKGKVRIAPNPGIPLPVSTSQPIPYNPAQDTQPSPADSPLYARGPSAGSGVMVQPPSQELEPGAATNEAAMATVGPDIPGWVLPVAGGVLLLALFKGKGR